MWDDSDREKMRKATEIAWEKARKATEGRKPRFGFRPDDRTGFMCKIDYECELGSAPSTPVYACLADLYEAHPCADDCGIVEVRVSLVRVVKETSPEY